MMTTSPSSVTDAGRQNAEMQRRALARRLAILRGVIRRRLLLAALTRIVACTLGLIGVTFAVDRLLRLDTSSRIALGCAALTAIVLSVWYWLARPLLARLEDLDLAELLDRRDPGLGQRIADLLQLPELLATPQFASAELVGAAIDEHAAALERFDFQAFVDGGRTRRDSALLATLVAATAAIIAFFPSTVDIWARRWLLAENVRWPQHTYLALEGLADRQRLLTPRGEPLLLRMTASPSFTRGTNGWQLAGRGAPLVVGGDESPQGLVPDRAGIAYALAGGTTTRATWIHYEDAEFRYEMPPLVEPVDITIDGGDDWFGPVRIEPIDRPGVKMLNLTSQSSASAAPETRAVGAADEPLMFLKGSQLELTLVGSEPLKSAVVLEKEGQSEPLERLDDKSFRLHWSMQEPRTFEMQLVSAESGLTSKPYFLTIGLLEDRGPKLTLRASGVGRRVTPQVRLPLAIHAADDFGLATLGLELERTDVTGEKPQTTDSHWTLQDFAIGAETVLPASSDLTPEVALVDHSVVPGQSIRLRASATDRCALGAHQGSSRWLSFQIVTPEELFYEILMRQREQRAKFAAALAQAQTQLTALEKLEAPLGAAAVSRAQLAVARQVWQIANHLDSTLREMTLNDLSTPIARQLLAEGVIQPLRELHDGPFERQRLQLDQIRMRDAIDPVERDAASENQRGIIRAMERILEQMSQWESFVDVVNQLRQIIKLQSELKDVTQQAQKKQTDNLFDE